MRFCRKIVCRCRIMLLILAMSAAWLPLVSCTQQETGMVNIADYGTFGSDLAKKMAASYPLRSPGSSQEKAAGDFIIKTLKDLGYQPIVTEFSFRDAIGQTRKSRNIAIKLEGRGFTRTNTAGVATNLERQVIIGAHYDTAITAEQVSADNKTTETLAARQNLLSGEVKEPELADYDGINDNASGIGALLTAAKVMRSASFGYDVILVAFGAGEADQAGARFFASQMGKAELAATDAMYCLDSIYAGDKVYAHSGHNSILAGYKKDYEKRRKLYEVTDVFYEFELYTHNNYMLYTNQASFDVNLAGFDKPVLYREWTFNESDYVPFDELGVPIVFFESYNYDEKTLAAMQESKNPAFGATKGMIRRTRFDSTDYLAQILNPARSTGITGAAGTAGITGAAGSDDLADTAGTTSKKSIDQLTRRINNTAFIILEAVRKGLVDATVR